MHVAREGEQQHLQVRSDRIVLVENAIGVQARVDEDELDRKLEKFLEGVIVLPHDLGRREIDPQQVPQRLNVSLGRGRCCICIMPPCGCFSALVAGTPWANSGNGSSKMAVGCPRRTTSMKLFICSWPNDEGCTANNASYVSVIGALGLTCTTSYCFFNSSISGSSGVGRNDLLIEAAEKLGIGRQNADPLPLLLADGADRPGQLVFDRDAAVDERNHDLVQARRAGQAQKDFLFGDSALRSREYWPARNAELLLRPIGVLAQAARCRGC